MEFPLINGKRRDFSSLELMVDGVPFVGLTALDYSDTLEPGVVRGASAMPIGTTRGQYSAQGSMTLLRAEFDILLAKLAAKAGLNSGYMEVPFGIVATYADDGDTAVTVDELVGCRIKTPSNSHSAGADALAVKIDLFVLYIKRNGVMPVGTAQLIRAASATL